MNGEHPNTVEHKSTDHKLDPELKAKWLEALRNNQYEQGRERLHNNGRYCCLGVLAVVSGAPVEAINLKGTLVEYDAPKLRSFLRQDMDREIQCKLENMNDGVEGERQHSFSEIADWVEANL